MYHQRKFRLKKRARFAFMIILVLTLLTGGGLWAAGFLDEVLYNVGLKDIPERPDAFEGQLNVLVMGMDTRKGEKIARADTIMLCSVDTRKNIMSVLSIPRDTRVAIPGHGWEKINSATVFGGPTLATKLVSDLLGMKVSNYVMVDYNGFKSIVDSLGGVTMDVKEKMYHPDPDDGGIYTIDIKPGLQRLNGDKALQFVRYRNYALGDIGRAEQQQKFLAAMVKEVLQPSTLVRLPLLIASTYKAVNTNLSLLEMKKLAVAADKMSNANLVAQTLPGKFLNMDGVSYWEPDPALTRQVVAGIFEGRTMSRVVMGETTINTEAKDNPETGDQKEKGRVVPGQPGGVKDQKTGAGAATGTSSKTGTTGQAPAGSGTKTTDGKKSTTGGTGSKAGTTGGQLPTGGIVPGVNPQQDQAKKEQSNTTVIITPKTVAN